MALLLLAGIVAGALGSSSPSSSRLEQVQALAAKDPIVHLNDTGYKNLISVRHRPYDALLVFTALKGKAGCAMCESLQPEVESLALALQQVRAVNATSPPIFVFLLDYTLTQKTFSALKFTSAPFVVYSSAAYIDTIDSKKPLPPMVWRFSDVYSFSTQEPTAAAMTKWLSGYHPTLKVRIPRILTQSEKILIATTTTFLLATIMGYFYVPTVKTILHHRMFYFALSMVWFYFVLSGTVFNMIRNPPPFQIDPRTQSYIFFARTTQHQYVVEGLIVAAAMLLSAFGGIGLSNIHRAPRSLSFLAFVLAFVGFVAPFLWVVALYRWKSPWYLR